MSPRLYPALALATTGILGAGLALASPTAYAAAPHDSVATASHSAIGDRQPLSPARLAAVRARQRELLARPRPATTLARAAAAAQTKVQQLTVTTTEDSDLADPNSTRCVDAATGGCSLRAAVDAANNRQTPVKIILGKHTYTLTTATELQITNPAGTSIVGGGSTHTSISGAGSRVLHLATGPGSSAPLLYLTDLAVTGGTDDRGAGLDLDSGNGPGSTVVLDGVAVTGNAATAQGGGIYAGSDSAVYARASTISDNTAPGGAGLYTKSVDANLSGVAISGNHSPLGSSGTGSGWLDAQGVIRMKGGSITGNTAGDEADGGAGGALYDQFGDVRLTDVHVDRNSATQGGGGMYLYSTLVEINGGSLSHDQATGQDARGGAIYVDTGVQLGLHGVSLARNRVGAPTTTGFGGGAIYLAGTTLGNQVTIDSGSSITGSNAGAIYAVSAAGHVDLSISDSRLARNTDAFDNAPGGRGCGGAICTDGENGGALNLDLSDSQVVGNQSTSSAGGGGGAVSVVTAEQSSAHVLLTRNVFESNVAGDNGYGGAVAFTDDDSSPISVRSRANVFIGNTSGTTSTPGVGGAVAVALDTTFSDTRSTFIRNRAVGDGAAGGGLYSRSMQTSTFTGTVFTHNSAGPGHGGDGYGGGIYSSAQSGSAFTSVTITRNHAASFGGGLYGTSNANQFAIEKSTVAGNHAGNTTSDGFGGGLYVLDGVLEVGNSTVANNQALGDGAGGGIYNAGPTMGMRYSTVSGNIAASGGGVYSTGFGGNVLGSIVSKNRRSAAGSEGDCAVASPQSRLHSLGGNVFGQGRCVTAPRTGDLVTRHPRLEELSDNGGPTKTMAVRATSPAVGLGTFQCPTTDQRGHDRPARHCDAGAFELPRATRQHQH